MMGMQNVVLIGGNSLAFSYKVKGFFSDGSDGKQSACNAGDLGSIPGQEDPLNKGMAIHSSILA